jgi:hypothetical protein
MKRTRKWVLVVPASVLVAAGVWLLGSGRAPAAPAVPAASSAASSDQAAAPAPPAHVAVKKLHDVEAAVAEKNRDASKDREAFIKDGWEMVSVAAPDHQVVNYDPKLIDGGRERDLKTQLLSTVPSAEQVGRVAEIARRAKDEATRYAAVEAMGRLNAPESTEALYDLLVNGGLDANDSARGQIAPLLRPSALDDPMAAKVAMLLDSPSLTAVEKQEIAFTLALIGLRDGMTLDPQLPLSQEARALIAQMAALAQARFVKALDRQGGNP